MGSQKTAEEIERELLVDLGPDLGVLFYHLLNAGHHYWNNTRCGFLHVDPWKYSAGTNATP